MEAFRRGDSGEAVRDIQNRLRAAGFPSEDEPGTFGEPTAAAVTAFQAAKGLAADAIVGNETWRALVESGYRLGDRLLYHRRPMQRGDDIAELQRRLNSLGFDAGKPDGFFGPDTLRALLDFQKNRHMAEDGKCGRAVVGELELINRATDKAGRDLIRERHWLSQLPESVAGHRLMLDPFARTEEEAAQSWEAAVAAARRLQEKGAVALLSRSADTRPAPEARAQRINRLGVDLVISFAHPTAEDAACFYFATDRSRSEAGLRLAEAIASGLKLAVVGRAYVMLRATRSPAVIVSTRPLGADLGEATAAGVDALFAGAALRPSEQTHVNPLQGV